jgi:PKHD-type hydroxylase
MNNDNHLYQFTTGINDVVIDSILQESENYEFKDGRIGPMQGLYAPKTRKSTISWICPGSWIAGMMSYFINHANTEYFKYDLSNKWADKLQYTVYDKNGDHYGWHTDYQTSSLDRSLIRKLSISLILSDPDEYEGGEFQVLNDTDSMITSKPPKGTALIFPSTLSHRVRPVKSGKRISLVGWYAGPRFK